MNPEQQKNIAEQQSAIDKRTVNIHLVTNGYIVGFPGHRMVFTELEPMIKELTAYFKLTKVERK